MKKIAILCLCICIVSSCFNIPKKVLSRAYPGQPRRDQYRLSRKEYAFNPDVDTSVVYLHKESWYMGEKHQWETVYWFIRFSGDGVAFYSNYDPKLPGEHEFNEMVNGQFCLYNVRDKKVTMELYDGMDREFYYMYGQINDSGISFTHDHMRHWWGGKEKLNHQDYIKCPAKLTKPMLFPI